MKTVIEIIGIIVFVVVAVYGLYIFVNYNTSPPYMRLGIAQIGGGLIGLITGVWCVLRGLFG